MSRPALIPCVIALTAVSTLATAEILPGVSACEPDAVCRLGGPIRQGAFSRAPWIPWLTDDPFVRAVDACLGYVVSRDKAVWLGGRIESRRRDGMTVLLGDGRTRIDFQDIRDDHFAGYGQLVCQYHGAPGLRMDLAEFWQWAALRLTAREGWRDSDELRGRLEFLRFYNPWIHATLRAYATADSAEVLRLQIDYEGPPVIFD